MRSALGALLSRGYARMSAPRVGSTPVNGGGPQRPTCRQPRLIVDSFHGLGLQRWYKLDSRKLSDRVELAVNLENQNLVVQTNDLSIRGMGLDLNVSRIYSV